MDIARAPKPKRRKYFYAGGAVVAIALITMALTRLEPAPPSVDAATLLIDSVRRGEMVLQVRGPGTLVPEHIRLITAVTAGRVEQLDPSLVGSRVSPSTKILTLSNPDVQLQALQAQSQLTTAEANLVTLKTNLQSQRLSLQQQYAQAQRDAEMKKALGEKKLASEIEVQNAADLAASLKQQLASLEESMDPQVQLAEANVQRLRDILKFNQDRIASMNVVAGDSGVLQQMDLQLGEWVNPGQQLATVAQPGKLKAVLRIPETQAKDIAIGQTASIDTRNGIIQGHVSRMDPASVNGTVGIDVSLDGELPKGARPDLSVDGTIEIERLENVLYVGRPAYGQAESTVGLFKLDPDGKTATRVNVKLGRSSVTTIVVEQGLNVGDRVILSDMSQWDDNDRVRLK
ncbi:MAG TPA: HlyD family efflux transporter periplasmic adaptor subunit [Gemmatimonadaceae bacterium]|nr:HlyD family efflux transporter periplasmic adaptor subunit [Gemmatimonadaceae bacterium]